MMGAGGGALPPQVLSGDKPLDMGMGGGGVNSNYASNQNLIR